jgi:hypothetical protein
VRLANVRYNSFTLLTPRLGGSKCADPELKRLFVSVRFQRSQERFEMLLEEALGANAVGPSGLDFLKRCLQTAPAARSTVAELLPHPFVTRYLSFHVV